MCAIIPFTGACSYRLLVHDSLQPSCIFHACRLSFPSFSLFSSQLRCFRHPSRHRQYWDEAALPPSTALTPIPSILPRRHSSCSLHVSGFDSLRTFTRHTSSGTGPVSMTLSCMSSPSHVSSCRSFLPCWSSAFQGLPSLRIFFHPCSLFNLSIFSVPAFLHISRNFFSVIWLFSCLLLYLASLSSSSMALISLTTLYLIVTSSSLFLDSPRLWLMFHCAREP